MPTANQPDCREQEAAPGHWHGVWTIYPGRWATAEQGVGTAAKRASPRAAPPPATAEPNLSDPALYLNRELSWMRFNERVLAQARDDSHPLLERVKFLAIAANNLDEFQMVGFANLLRQWRADVDTMSPDGLDIDERVFAVRQATNAMIRDFAVCWDELQPLLAEHDIRF